MKLMIDPKRPHVIRSTDGAIVAVLVDYPLCREDIGKKIVDGFNSQSGITENKEINPSTLCTGCNKPHHLSDEDAGSDREMRRLCLNCYRLFKGWI